MSPSTAPAGTCPAAGGAAVAPLAVPVAVRTGADRLADELLTNGLVVVVRKTGL
ncbi:hypothetical protein [Actinomadura terrae]|uniref:hypothetical protein n=1 Tax=Actinomadura terrae TaxID=604353 RepID=UPI001FA6D6C1|nr:hypothetical protein [Actinomadura terrae]